MATLLVMAAWMGSRYWGLKQIDGFGPSHETILEFSLYDALQAWFTKAVIVLRKEIYKDFMQVVGYKLSSLLPVTYVFQEMDSSLPAWFSSAHRTKPWGTGHAVLVAQDAIDEPFAVINADDYYWVESFLVMFEALSEVSPTSCVLLSYVLENTLSSSGSVNRGVCSISSSWHLSRIEEYHKIHRTSDNTIVDMHGRILSPTTPVSMNFFGFHPSFFTYLSKQFSAFLAEKWHDATYEFYIPSVVNSFINSEGTCIVPVCNALWCGVTHPDDKPLVQEKLWALFDQLIYPTPLWKDILTWDS